MDKELFNKRKRECLAPSFRDKMILELGCTCGNCGRDNTEIPIEYHHIVPLALGGTNNINNLVALCTDCHKLAHGARVIHKMRHEHGNLGGRPRFQPVDNYREILDRFIRGEIGKSECQKLLGMKAGKLNDMDFYHEYLEELGIVHMRNMVDAIRTDNFSDTRIVSYVVYNDGKRTDYAKCGSAINSIDMPTVVKYQDKKRKKRTRIRTIAQ